MGSTHNNWPFILNLGNSIIGVALLAMPYCFQKCGIILSMVVLVLCTWLTLISCKLLMKAGITSRRRSYEFLAYYTHGAPGKFISEIGMIGFQLGTLIAQIVVIGDLGPSIVKKFFGIENSSGLRIFLIVLLCMSVGLPMALIRDIRSVSRVSAVCVAFYSIFVLYVFVLAVPNLWLGDWYEKVYFWRTEGFFQSLPILSFSFGCQTQLFLLYDALPEPSLKAMSKVVNSAVNLCAVAYLLVGFCGYVAFYTHDIPGDVIGIFPNTFFTDLMKVCFVFSIVITFPVMVFPCRASIYTLLFAKFKQDGSLHHDDDGDDDDDFEKSKARDEMMDLDTHMPAKELKIITFSLVVGSMIIAILIPNVEFILGMNGAIMGTLICYIFPALFFLKVMGNDPKGKNMAQMVLILGITILLVSTYSTLRSQENVSTHINEQVPVALKPADSIIDNLLVPKNLDIDKIQLKDIETASKQLIDRVNPVVVDDVRKEPPNPHPPDSIVKPAEDVKSDSQIALKKDTIDEGNNSAREIVAGIGDKLAEASKENDKLVEANKAKELELQEKEKKQKELLAELEKQRHEQQMLIEEQRQLLKAFKDHHDKDMKVQGAPHQENAVNQPLPQPADLQPAVIQQQPNGQEPVARPERSSEDKQGIPSQQLHPLPAINNPHLDNINLQQVVLKAAQQVGQVNIVNDNEKPKDDLDSDVDLQEDLPRGQFIPSKIATQTQEIHIVTQGIYQLSTQFDALEITEGLQNQVLDQQETPQDVNKQQLQFQPEQKENQMVQLETRFQQPQVPQPEYQLPQMVQHETEPQQTQVSKQELQQPQISQQGQPQILSQEQRQQPETLSPELHLENVQAHEGALQQQLAQFEKRQSHENMPQKLPNLDTYIREKRDASEKINSLVNETETLKIKENQNSSLHNEASQQKSESDVTTKGDKSVAEQNMYSTSTENVSEKLSNSNNLQDVENDNQKPKTNEEMRRKLKSLDYLAANKDKS